jgi:DNA repair exonuclease SbcCD nuclease subunit
MERQINNPSAILCSDWHLREDIPVCRTDDYWSAQWRKVDFISDLQKKYICPVLHAGDLFDHWKPSPNLLRETIKHLPKQFYTIYGQHDLPQHSLNLVDKCGINVLEADKTLKILKGVHWGQVPTEETIQDLEPKFKILVWHKMNYQGKLPYPGCVDPSSASLLRKHPQFDLILTGDNHKTFTEEFEGRRLVNPGALMRMEADEINHKPCVFLWDNITNKIEQIFIPIEQDVISREHIEKIEQRDARIDAYISKFDMEWESKFTFKENLENFKKTNTVRDSVMELVYKATDE